MAVGEYDDDFTQVMDEEARAILDESRAARRVPSTPRARDTFRAGATFASRSGMLNRECSTVIS
jgi:hypothetical protein